MIAAVTGRFAIFHALVLILPCARAADDLNAAARELARKTAAAAKGEAVSATWRNVSSMGAAELAQARSAFEGALQEAGGRSNAGAQLAAHLTLSENPAQLLLVEEFQDDVWIASWKRGSAPRLSRPGMSLESKLVWEQNEPILDAALVGNAVLVLSPSRIALGDHRVPIASGRPWPRDPRGRLRITGDTFHAYLPGMVCTGTISPSLHADCRNSDEPWVLDSGRALLLATFAANRNYFDGRIITQSGARKSVMPFFAAAALEQQGRTNWLLTTVDGRTQIFDTGFEPAGTLGPWGSDIAALDTKCGNGPTVLATRPTDGSEPDAVQAFAVADHAAVPVTSPVNFAGPVTALWPTGPNSAIAVARDPATGKYSAYVLTLSCGL